MSFDQARPFWWEIQAHKIWTPTLSESFENVYFYKHSLYFGIYFNFNWEIVSSFPVFW